MSGVQVGEVTHYFDHINVAVLALTEAVRVGETVHFLGRATDFKQEIASLQIEHKPVEQAEPGQDVALKVAQKVRPGDKVFCITDED